MSLTSFVEDPDVKAMIRQFRPKLSRRIPAQLLVPPRSNRYSLVGTAFDYLLRFEIQRRASHAVVRPWVAEEVPEILRRYERVGLVPSGTAERSRTTVAEAQATVAAYIRCSSSVEQADVAGHAIRLAKLDGIYRAGDRALEGDLFGAAPEDVEDLLGMLAIAPFEMLLHDQVLLLNPTFGEASELVDGADADLICGDSLLECKTSKKGEVQTRDLDQLFGYFLLARQQRGTDGRFPDVRRVACYFARHAYLWPIDVRVWTWNPDFLNTEAWFFTRARETQWK
jgi:hypothetical protein